MRTAPVARGFFTGDYEGLTALGGDFWSLVSESRGSTDAWSSRLTTPFAGPSYTPSAEREQLAAGEGVPGREGAARRRPEPDRRSAGPPGPAL